MITKTWLQTLSLCLAAAGTAPALAARVDPRVYVFHEENVLGTSLDVKMHAASEADAKRAEAAALAEFDRETKILSAWTPESEFSRWVRTQGTPVRVSPELFEVLALFDRWRERTGGALDASAETAVRAWKLAAGEHRKPTEAELSAAVSTMQRPHWRLNATDRTATHLDDAPIALNSFAKSYIAGHAADEALHAGASGIVLNVGGDLVLRGDLTEQVQIANPRADAENDPAIDTVRLANRTIATSGSYRRGVDVGGEHFSHIVDPRTGEAVDAVLSSTVIAGSPAEAGALATAFSVMSPAESQRLAATLGVDYLLVLRNGGTVASAGWSRLEVPRLQTASYSRPAAADGQMHAVTRPALDLLITLELARMDDPRYRRPYVAVWVEDQSHKPVRTIALWSGRPRWLDELKNYYRTHPLASSNESELSPSISSATRPPGKYTLRWDGSDDARVPLKPGRYTICVEAAREHGTYQMQRHEIDFDGKTEARFEMPAGTEIAGVELDYARHAPAGDGR